MLASRLVLALSCLTLVGACNTKPASPLTMSGHAPIAAGPSERRAAATSGPVEVTYFAPRGETEGQIEISVSFDRPMVALAAQTEAAADVLRIEPAIPGRARWVGSQTLLFEPSAALPMATEFRVKVPKTLRALDGNELASELEFSFATPVPKVTRSDPASGATGEAKQRPIELFFNQRVSTERVQEHVELSYVTPKKRTPTVLAVKVDRPDPLDQRRVRLRAEKAFPLSAEVTVKLSAGFSGEEGARPLVQAFASSFAIYGPLRVLPNPACTGADCVPKLSFSNPVSIRAARARLRFEPALVRPLASEEDYTTDELYFGDELAPNTTYKVRVEGELRDVFGNLLEGERVATVRTPPYPAVARFMIEGDLVAMTPASKVPALRMQLQNLKNAELELAALGMDEVFAGELEGIRPSAHATKHALGSAPAAERKVVEVDPTPWLKNGRGLVLATLRAQSAGEEQRERRLLAFTDLAPTLKAGSEGGIVWLTRLSDAQPVPGAQVRITRGLTTVATGKTDAQGTFAFKLPPATAGDDGSGEPGELAAVVQHGDDISFVRKLAGVGPWELTEHASYEAQGSTSAHLFSERGVYRPGDTLQLKGILRSLDARAVDARPPAGARTAEAGGMVPTRGEVTVSVLDASESLVERSTVALNAYGSFVKSVRIPGSVELGPLQLTVQHGSQQFSHSVEVAEYRAAELELSLRTTRERALRGEQLEARLDGQYLFGAPAKAARVYWNAHFVQRDFVAPKHAGFTFHDEDEGLPFTHAGSAEGELDERGALAFTVPLTDAPLAGPSRLELETSVLLNNTQAATTASVDVTPAQVVVGLRPASSVSESEKPLLLELVALSPRALPKAHVPLEVTLDRRVFTTEIIDGRRERSAHDERVGSCKKKSELAPVSCSFTPKQPGLYIARVQGKDGKGRVSRAARWVYVSGAGQASWGEDPGYLLSLKSERTAYKLGEVAKVLVPSPFAEAEALVTIERDGVLSTERLKVGPASTLELRVDERFVPNAFVSVLLVRPVAQSADAAPDYRIGTLELSADVSERKLAVEVKPDQDEKRPGEELAVQLSVRDGNGKPTQAELTVFAVDEGVLSLTGYRTPDPFAAIYAPRALSIWTSDARASLATILAGPGDDKGGEEGGGGGQLLRSNFAAVALFVPSLETDGEGHASVRFKLPDAVTRYRIMAVAASRGAQVGSGAAAVRTKKPLMLRPQLSRVLRAGDLLGAGVVVHNELAHEVDAEVELAVRGIALTDAPKQRVHVPAHGQVEVRYALRAERVGEAQLTFRASAGAESDAISVTRRVLSPSALETVSVAGETSHAARETLAPLSGLRTDVGGLDLTLSTSALSELEQPARALLAYEYGCTEQLSSRLIAVAALEQLRVPLALRDAPLAPLAESLASELERHQRADGGFGLWSASDQTSPALSAYLTGYALLAFAQQQAAGLTVSSHAVERAKQYLASYLRSDAGRPDAGARAGSLAERTFLVYALARAGAYDPAYAGKLFEQRAELPAYAQLELAHALLHDGENKVQRRAQIDTLLSALSSHVRVTADQAHVETNLGDGYRVQFVSDVRASAELVLLLLEHAPQHVLLPKLARWLSGARARDGAWTGTHETAWGVQALAAYYRAQESVRPDMKAQVSLGAQTLGPTQLSGHRAQASFHVALRDVPSGGAALTFDKQGQGRLHYALRLTYAQSELPTKPVERGFFVERSYERIDPAALARGDVAGEPTERAKVGDYVRVTLRVAVPSARSFVMISDPLPAGLEPVDFTLATELAGAARALTSFAPRDHQELRDDRALFAVNELPPGLYRYTYLARASSRGRFVAPPAKVEEMYHPETQGLSAAQVFTVDAP
ncbi:MAG: hypothetical protein JWN48_3449 [Myxococcaceae bacterium]|nr:hypothetical protein [Myxococcaceae bacterium]